MARTTWPAYVEWSAPTRRSRPAVAAGAGQVGDVAAGADPLDADAGWGLRRAVAISSSMRRGRGASPTTSAGGATCGGATKPPAASRSADPRRWGTARSPMARSPPAARQRPGLGGEHAGGEQRAHLQPVEQPAATGEVVHQLGVVLGELVEVGRDPVAVEGVGLDQAGLTIAPPSATSGAR